jgi:predicted Zn-ribbon and HTH transcriptional regulator
MGTIRQEIIRLLQHESMDLYQLAQTLGMAEKEVMTHLPHVAQSVSAKGGHLKLQAALCRDCDFLFKERRRLSPPGRCPRCRKNRIDGPWYKVEF